MDLTAAVHQIVEAQQGGEGDNGSNRAHARQRDADQVQQLLAPVIKSVYDVGCETEFLQRLESYARDKEEEIERLCQDNHQGFVESVEQLLKVKQETAELQGKIQGLNADLQRVSGNVAARKKDVLAKKRVEENVDAAITTLQSCIRVLGLANKVNELIQARKNYAALRSLDELSSVHLQEIANFDFAEKIRGSIPSYKTKILDAVMADLREWLLGVREKSRLVGQVAFDETYNRHEQWLQIVADHPRLRKSQINSPIELIMNEPDECKTFSSYEANGVVNVTNNDTVTIDFVALFDCLHIHEELGLSAELKRRYESDRRQQKDLLIPTAISLQEEDLGKFDDLLADIAGFVIIERVTIVKALGFRSEDEVERLWRSMCRSLSELITAAIVTIVDPTTLLKVKDILVLFMRTVERHGYAIQDLQKITLSMFKTYSDILEQRFSNDFSQVIVDDDYMPMTVNNMEEYENVLRVSWYTPETQKDQIRFPHTLPFSQLYPLCCIDIRTFVDEYYLFIDESMRLSHDVDEILRQCLDDLLLQQVNKTLASRLQSQNLTQIAQIFINLEYLKLACGELEALLEEQRTNIHGGPIKLQATSTLINTSKTAENRIFELVNTKIDDFLELSDYDWVATTQQKGPSHYIQDVVRYMTTVVTSILTNLPEHIKTFVYFDALDHLATSLIRLIMNDVRRISDAAVVNLDTDATYLEDFVQTLDDPSLRNLDTFLELRQSINLMKDGGWQEYQSVQSRMKNFNRVTPQSAAILLDKLLANLPLYPLNVQDRNRRKALENASRELKKP